MDLVKPIVALPDSAFQLLSDHEIHSDNYAKNIDQPTKNNESSTSIESVNVAEAHANSSLVQLLSDFEFRGHRCLVFPLYGMNLFEYLKQKEFKGLPLSAVKKIAVQLLHCLVLLKVSENIFSF